MNERNETMLDKSRFYPVPKTQLLAKLRENRAIHIKTYNEAKEEYRKAAISALSTEIAKAKDGLEFSLQFHEIIEPKSYAREYDQAIGLMEMTIDETIPITASDYTSFVLDEWSWKEHFTSSVANYSKR